MSEDFALPYDAAWLAGLTCYAESITELAVPHAAAPLHRLLAPYRHCLDDDGVGVRGPVATFLGGLAAVLGHFDEAESHFECAADLCVRGGMVFFQARNRLLWGRMLLERSEPGDADRARDLLLQARGTAAERGYGGIEQKTIEALARCPA